MRTGNAWPRLGEASVSVFARSHAFDLALPAQRLPRLEGSLMRMLTRASAPLTPLLMRPSACPKASLSICPDMLPSADQRFCCFARTHASFTRARGLLCAYWRHTSQVGLSGHVGHAIIALPSIVMLSASTPMRGPMSAVITTLLFTTTFEERLWS